MMIRLLFATLIVFYIRPALKTRVAAFVVDPVRHDSKSSSRLSYPSQIALFSSSSSSSAESSSSSVASSSSGGVVSLTIESATDILAEWDRVYNPDNAAPTPRNSGDDDEPSTSSTRQPAQSRQEQLLPQLADAIRTLNDAALAERTQDSTTGRVMLGICAASAPQGIAALKSWVTNLALPRGLLHGMDKDGVPLELTGGVYIKYNSGGVYTFADIRKSGLGFDALWKPGDALLEPYDGTYRGVYFQVELMDQVFRQFLVPLDVFDSIE